VAAPAAEDATALVAAVEKCGTYEGKPREAKWTDEEATAYWKEDRARGDREEAREAPAQRALHRDHELDSARAVCKKLETKYAAIKKILPFEEAKGRRLLPILLFRTDDDFQTFYRHVYKMEPKDEVGDGSLVLDRTSRRRSTTTTTTRTCST
jgi:hypothetical protein